MLASPKNRSKHCVDNPLFDDGFYQHYRFKSNRRTGSPTGGRGPRRALRAKEKTMFKRELREQI